MGQTKPGPIVFVVTQAEDKAAVAPTRGATAQPLSTGLPRGTVKQAVRVGTSRGSGGEVRLAAQPGEDVVVLHVLGGPALVLHPENARDLLLAQAGAQRARGATAAAEENEIAIPARLRWAGLEQAQAQRGVKRSGAADVVVSAVEIVTGIGTDALADFAASKVVRDVDAQVDPGVYALDRHALPTLKGSKPPLAEMKAAPDGGPLLVFVHGTFSETSGTFGKLWLHHPDQVAALFDHYGDRVYGLDHPTLGASPIANALLLANACPPGAKLHLITHSRGGLVAEVMSRVCAKPDLSKADLAFFAASEYRPQLDALKALAKLVRERKLTVERVVRVACPARGTLLASKRLDAYLSVLKWSLELAQVPVVPVLVDFLAQVARCRADPRRIPGLAAQIPDSPLVQWIHAADEPIAGDLRIVAGDLQGDSVMSWFKTLLADAYFWTDNDLVVQTSSMYGGAPREAGATFVFDQGGKVSHFNYFFNQRTVDAVVSGLVQAAPSAFRVVGPLSWAGKSSTGLRAAIRGAGDGAPQPDKPAVFILPGILGSNLKVDGKRIWLSWRVVNGLKRIEYGATQPDGIEPDGPIGLTYDDLEAFLANTHEVIEFGYDWRRPLEEEARRLATAVDAALAARKQTAQPVRIVAHSMGGLLARTMLLEKPDTWQRMMALPGARLLMLGTPNGGSWAPMQVLSGDDTFGNALVAFGAPFQDHVARQLMAGMPGFIQLQAALLDASKGLDKHETWQKLADDDLAQVRQYNSWHHEDIQLAEYQWGVPTQDVIDRAVSLRRRLDAQRDGDLVPFVDRILLVIGKAAFTPDGYEVGEMGLDYLNAAQAGDGRVTADSARIAGVRTWQIDCEHGKLPAQKSAFTAYRELLDSGTTSLLTAAPAAARGAAMQRGTDAHVRSRPSRARLTTRPPEAESDVLSLQQDLPSTRPAAGTSLKISVINGDLMFVRQPLMLGHYTSLRLTGTEAVVDNLLDHAMSLSLNTGLYPDAPGAQQIFINKGAHSDNPLQLPRPAAAIVIGLGAENKLDAANLVLSVRQGVIAWARHLTEAPGGAPAVFELASTLLGSGGIGITVGQAARLIAQGVRDANERLAENNLPVVGHLYLVELFLDRAGDVWRALQVQSAAAPGQYDASELVKVASGALPRLLDSGYRGAEYDFISAQAEEAAPGEAVIAYTLDTRRARSEVRAQQAQSKLLTQLIAGASSDENTDPQIGSTLFKLLIPMEMEPFLGGTTDLQLEVDTGTAGIPWELLDNASPGATDSLPWAIRVKLLRKLRMADFRSRVTDANTDASVLVIGEPACDPKMYPRLPGARAEANAVAQCLASANGVRAEHMSTLISPDDPSQVGPDARTVINALLGRDWRIVHIAGHGEPPDEKGDPRGVVLSDGTFLGPREIRNMRVVPELVFVNCCHLAARDNAQLFTRDSVVPPSRSNRPRFAAGVAEELIKIGVRCVIAAGWAVDDAAASGFATHFYQALLRGDRFIDAVADARKVAWEMGSNTWAAYQCYGDPDWRFVAEAPDAQRAPRPTGDEFAGIAAAKTLTLALETLAVQSKFQKRPAAMQRPKIRYLESRFANIWGNIGEVAEAFGVAWAETGERREAVRWYARALDASDGTASLRVVEQLGNLRARNAADTADKAIKAFAKEAAAPLATTPVKKLRGTKRAAKGSADRKVGKPAASGHAALLRKRDIVIADAREEITAALDLLERTTGLQPTVERESLCASAWKRLAMVEAGAQNAAGEAKAIERMKLRYQRAMNLARETGSADLFYPALNWMAAELMVNGGKRGWRGFDPAACAEIRDNLAEKTRNDPDFWSVVAVTELRAYEAVARSALAAELDSILREYDDLHTRVDAHSMWDSVYKQAEFVLPKYAARASPAERKAVEKLTRHLKAFALGRQDS